MDHGIFCKGVFGPKKALGRVGYGKKYVCLLKYVVRIDERREREERRAGASGLEDTFGGKINVGEEYEGQNKYRFPGRLQKGAIQYIICQSWWKIRD